MKKYLLIEVIDREIAVDCYDTYQDAYKEMEKRFCTFSECCYDCEFTDFYAWVNDGGWNHSNIDMKIVNIELY